MKSNDVDGCRRPSAGYTDKETDNFPFFIALKILGKSSFSLVFFWWGLV